MARNIKRIAHDLIPLSDAVTELSTIISQLLDAIKPHAQFDDQNIIKYFDECVKASQKMALSSQLIKQYVHEVDKEADRERILKD
ncbi:MAG: hypothetical protein HKM04_06460 [Legionellales bacterium]|nr:hypothetical protein [Legionellales bacterium]